LFVSKEKRNGKLEKITVFLGGEKIKRTKSLEAQNAAVSGKTGNQREISFREENGGGYIEKAKKKSMR